TGVQTCALPIYGARFLGTPKGRRSASRFNRAPTCVAAAESMPCSGLATWSRKRRQATNLKGGRQAARKRGCPAQPYTAADECPTFYFDTSRTRRAYRRPGLPGPLGGTGHFAFRPRHLAARECPGTRSAGRAVVLAAHVPVFRCLAVPDTAFPGAACR